MNEIFIHKCNTNKLFFVRVKSSNRTIIILIVLLTGLITSLFEFSDQV